MNFGSSGHGRGRGRGKAQNLPLNAWNPQKVNCISTRKFEKKVKTSEVRGYKENYSTQNGRHVEDEWKDRENARESRLQKAKKIKEDAAANFSHLLAESDSSDEELREEEILRKTMNSYKLQLNGEEPDVSEPSNYMSAMLQAGETTCPVCIDQIKHADPVWSCHICFGIFHILCIQRWARQNIGVEKLSSEDSRTEDSFVWCCPNCRHTYTQSECPTRYICFCGKEEDPKFDPWMIPHSCGQKCGKLLMPSCGHECLLLCHPGPCPPCPKTVKTKCHCGRSGPLTQRCSKKNWSCGSVCGKLLACGHHKCSSPCHAGVCPSCSEKSIQSCICSRNRDLRDCADPVWKCNETCDKVLECGNHTCEEICHKDECAPCPRSGKRACPCGKMRLQLPCTEDIPTCEDTCDKLLECGRHYCHRQCHYGACETCRQIITKKCRCGKCSKELPCCQVFTCEFKCTKMKNCNRHPCKRKCCDGNCPPCEQTCNRLLSCRNHKCPAPCHTGSCFPCPLKQEVKCFCGSVKIAVNCGAERSTRPPKCRLPCRIPSTCHHEKRELHKCHFNRCPPCRQICGHKLDSCGHYCPESCHDEIAVKKFSKPMLSSERKSSDVEVMQFPCPPCQVPIERECFGKHEVRVFPCSEVKPFSCRRKCGRTLECGNHFCQLECHLVQDGSSDNEVARECLQCEEPCLKPRPEGCTHSCKRRCHPDECPPCTNYVRISCHCSLIMLELKCSTLTEGNESLRSCKNQCPKVLSCGHRCKSICHPGDCPRTVCNQKVKIFCPCKRRKKETRCNLLNSGETKIECDEKCRELKDEEEKAKEKREAAIKEEEMKKQQEELEWFKRKTEGRKRKQRKVQIEEKTTLFSKRNILIFSSIIILLLSIFIAYFALR